MTRYQIGAGSKLRVTARSKVHDTSTVWDTIAGDAEADAATLATAGATGRFTVDMTRFDAGDWLKNRKLKGDFELDKHPRAEFELREVRGVVAEGDRFRATARGVLRWRGKEVELEIAGEGALGPDKLEATGRFELDIRRLGLSAPRFLMIKMEDEVAVEVTLRGTARTGAP
ncbi:MAG TPA: YceI family protein [Kofleriaceae bacterium]|nr:YceI family protein [Kofleriaceae bacterium]